MYAWYFSWLPLKLCLIASSSAFWMSSSETVMFSSLAMFSICAFSTRRSTIGCTIWSW